MERFRPDEKDVFDVHKRFKKIQSLRRQLGLASFGRDVYTQTPTDLAYPTIGIEIEMTWTQAFPAMAARWEGSADRPSDYPVDSEIYQLFSTEYDCYDSILRPKLKKIESVIPRVGEDAYWEFSFLPTKQIEVTRAEVQTLYDASILYPGIEYATHMTVASIDNARDAYALLCSLEQAGGSSPDRLLLATAWTRKSRGGLRKRSQDELVGRDTVGYELRTLITTSPTQVSSLLENAQKLALMQQSQPEQWREYRADIEQQLVDADLPLKPWENPRINNHYWQTYGSRVLKSV